MLCAQHHLSCNTHLHWIAASGPAKRRIWKWNGSCIHFCCCGKNMRTIEDRFVCRLFYKIYGVVRCEYEISCDRCSLAIYQTIMLALFLRTELTKCRQEESLKHEYKMCVCAEDAYSCTLHTRLHVHSRRIVQIFVHLIQCTLCCLRFTI